MDSEVAKQAHERLRALREALLSEQGAAAAGEAPVELDQARMGRLSRMDDMQHQAMALELKRRRDLQLQRIEGAFQRLEKGVYGTCVKCGTPIAPKRLEFDPTVFFCQDCAAQADRR